MASGEGRESALNRLRRKSGSLTPKLRKKNATAPCDGCESGASASLARGQAAVCGSPDLAGAVGGHAGTGVVGADFHMKSLCAGSKLSVSSEDLGPNSMKATAKRKSKTLTFRRKTAEPVKDISGKKSGGNFWTVRLKKRLPVRLRRGRDHGLPDTTRVVDTTSCVCTGYRRTDEHVLGPGLVFAAQAAARVCGATASPLQPSAASRSARLALGAGPGPTGMRRCNPQLLQLVPAPPQQAPLQLPLGLAGVVGGGLVGAAPPAPMGCAAGGASCATTALIDLARFNPDEYPTEDVDELLIAQRARDMELGIEISPNHVAYPHLHYSTSATSSSSGSSSSGSSGTLAEQVVSLGAAFHNQCVVTTTTYPTPAAAAAATGVAMPGLMGGVGIGVGVSGASGAEGHVESAMAGPSTSMLSFSSDSSSTTTSQFSEYSGLAQQQPHYPGGPGGGGGGGGGSTSSSSFFPRTVHTQVDYIHCLVPDLLQITSCTFYWGVMDRYEAERLLENRPEGTFLLRDSAQEEFLFSVSFRRYGRSLHARIEQWNHKFSFDSHDPGVFASDTVCGLIEHYKDPSCCMFFEPMLTIPLNRTFPFSLQHLCRAAICSHATYDGVNLLPLPKPLHEYLKYYHYKQKVRVRCFEIN